MEANKKDFEEELKRKKKEIRGLYIDETSECKLCVKGRKNEYGEMGSYSFCVEHGKKFEEKRKKEVEEGKVKNKIDELVS